MRSTRLVRGLLILGAISFALIPACKNMPFGWEQGSPRSKRELVCFKGHTLGHERRFLS
jgi:hypothetical protein